MDCTYTCEESTANAAVCYFDTESGRQYLCEECYQRATLILKSFCKPLTTCNEAYGCDCNDCEGVKLAKRQRETMNESAYVVTFNPAPIVGRGAIDGLRRMSLTEARATLQLAARIPKRGRIVNVATLEVVA